VGKHFRLQIEMLLGNGLRFVLLLILAAVGIGDHAPLLPDSLDRGPPGVQGPAAWRLYNRGCLELLGDLPHSCRRVLSCFALFCIRVRFSTLKR
jgi:hypothetical protein